MSNGQLVAQSLYWSFSTNAGNASVAVGPDGSVVTAYGVAGLSPDLYAAYGQITPGSSTPSFKRYGIDGDFDTGESPLGVAIDSNGLTVSVHETDLVTSTQLWLNIGSALGGQGNLSGAAPHSTTMVGQNPSIISIGPGQFIVASKIPGAHIPPAYLGLWQLQISVSDGKALVLISPVNIDTSNLSLLPLQSGLPCWAPRPAYNNGVLAITSTGAQIASTSGLLGNYDASTATWTPTTGFQIPSDAGGVFPEMSVSLGPNASIYTASISDGNILIQAGAYSAEPGGAVNFTLNSNPVAGFNLPANYPVAIDIAYTQSCGLNGLVMAVLSYSQDIDLFFVPSPF